MPAPSATWTVKTVQATYRSRLTLLLEPGSYEVEATGRIVNTLTDGSKQIFLPGKIASGTLNTTPGLPSLSLEVPVVDDPDNSPNGGEIILTIAFTNGTRETLRFSPLESWNDIVDLATIITPQLTPTAPPLTFVGVPGGLAALDADGDVVDADGVKVISGGGGGGGPADWTTLLNKPAVVAAGADQAAARSAIGAGTGNSNLVIGTAAGQAADAAELATSLSGKADDSVVVKLTGAQTVAGVKTFSSAPAVPDAAWTIAKTSGLQAALDGKTDLASAVAAAKTAILGAGVPSALDTLDELAAALGDDANYAATTTTALSNRVRHDTAAQGLTGTQQANARANLNVRSADNSPYVIYIDTGTRVFPQIPNPRPATPVTFNAFQLADFNPETELPTPTSHPRLAAGDATEFYYSGA